MQISRMFSDDMAVKPYRWKSIRFLNPWFCEVDNFYLLSWVRLHGLVYGLGHSYYNALLTIYKNTFLYIRDSTLMDSRIQWDQNPTQTRIKTTKSISGRCQGQVLGDYDNINTIYAKDRAHYAKEKGNIPPKKILFQNNIHSKLYR